MKLFRTVAIGLVLAAASLYLAGCNTPQGGCTSVSVSLSNVSASCSAPGLGSVTVNLSPVDAATLLASNAPAPIATALNDLVSGITTQDAVRGASASATPPPITASYDKKAHTVTFTNAATKKSVTVPIPTPSPIPTTGS